MNSGVFVPYQDRHTHIEREGIIEKWACPKLFDQPSSNSVCTHRWINTHISKGRVHLTGSGLFGASRTRHWRGEVCVCRCVSVRIECLYGVLVKNTCGVSRTHPVGTTQVYSVLYKARAPHAFNPEKRTPHASIFFHLYHRIELYGLNPMQWSVFNEF